jgi:hypothetical protein
MYLPYCDKKILAGKPMRIWIRYTAFFLKKFADLRFADWHTSEMCGFAIVECGQEFADLRFEGLQKKFACPHLTYSITVFIRVG